ncbi:MAG: hypothetical protein QXN68_02780, partial [Thermoplasmata archaeon]
QSNVKKKDYQPSLSGQEIDHNYRNAAKNELDSNTVSGAKGGGLLSMHAQITSDPEVLFGILMSYMLNKFEKIGLEMQDALTQYEKSVGLETEIDISESSRDRSPVQAARIERQISPSGDITVTTVRAENDVYKKTSVVKSIFVSLDDSGSMHSFISNALMAKREIKDYVTKVNNIVDKFIKNYGSNTFVARQSNANVSADENMEKIESVLSSNNKEEFKNFYKKIVDYVNENLKDDEDSAWFMNLALYSMLNNFDRFVKSVDNIAGLAKASESPYEMLCGTFVSTKKGYSYWNFKNNTPDIIKSTISEFMSNTHGGNEDSYTVGKFWGAAIAYMMFVNAALHILNSPNFSPAKLLRYDWAIGIMHLTDLYYELKGFVRGFYDGIYNFVDIVKSKKVNLVLGNVSLLPEGDSIYMPTHAKDEMTMNNYQKLSELLNYLGNDSDFVEKIDVKYEDYRFNTYFNGKLVSSIKPVLLDVAIFNFGKHATEEVKRFIKNEYILATHAGHLEGKTLKDLSVQVKKGAVVLPKRMTVYNESSLLLFSLVLVSKVVLYKEIKNRLKAGLDEDSVIEYAQSLKRDIYKYVNNILMHIENNAITSSTYVSYEGDISKIINKMSKESPDKGIDVVIGDIVEKTINNAYSFDTGRDIFGLPSIGLNIGGI